MPHDDINQILTRLSPGKFDAQRAVNFDIERAKGLLESSFKVERLLNVNEEERTADFSFASDEPIEHWFGCVILETEEKAVDLSRVDNGVCPFLVNHRTDQQVGVVQSVKLGKGKVSGTVKFSRSPLGEEIFQDVKDGIRNGTSIGFLIHDMILEKDEEGEMPVYRAKKWEMLENSSASIPADYRTVGAGRSFEKQTPEPISEPPSPELRENLNTTTEKTMAKENEIETPGTPVVEAPVTRSADEIATDEITRWGENLGCPDLAKRYLTETFADEKDITVTAFKQFVKANQKAASEIPVPSAERFSPARVDSRVDVVSIGEAFIRSLGYTNSRGKSLNRGFQHSVEVPIMPSALLRATLDSASTGLQGYIDYQAGPIMVEQQRLTVRDLLAVGQTSLPSVPYIKETSYTNAATTVAEEGLKPEATFALQDEFAPVKKIAVIGRVSMEAWEDFTIIRDYINGRLRFMVAEREEAQLLSGAGTGSEITGILTESIQSQAFGASTPTASDHGMAFHNAITKIRATGKFEPDGMVVHPDDWQQMRLAQDDNKQYYGGGPFSGPYGVGPFANAERYWGLPVVVTTAITSGTGLVGAFKLGAQIWDRQGITVDTTNSDEDDFQYNRMAIRVEERLALAIYRPLAFCKVTGI